MHASNSSNPRKPYRAIPAASIDPKRDEFEDFVYLLSHDVRASVRALLEVPQWIQEDLIAEGHTVSGSLRENITLMDTHTQRLDRMLIDLLSYSRVARNQQIMQIDLADAIETVVEQLSLQRNFVLTTDIQIPPLVIGEQDILTLLAALITNAVKHHDKSAGNVHISAYELPEGYVIEVRDDGPGIEAKFYERVFGAMTTLKPRDEVEGSGMGLAIARKIVDHYGGEISLSNIDGSPGLCVHILFDKTPHKQPISS